VINAAGWSTQLMVNAGGWSTQVGGQHSWVVGADGWSAQQSGNKPFFWGASSLAAGACPDRGKRGGKRGVFTCFS
jgi:hypothetical protein